MSEEVERIGPVDTPEITAETPAEPILSSPGATLSSPRVAFSDDVEALGANLRNVEDNLAYLRMSEMRQDALIQEVQDRMSKIELAVEKVRFYLTFALGLVLASMAITMISLLHEVGVI